MPEYTEHARLPIPFDTEADQVPADLKAALSLVDEQLVLRAANTADRDARYNNTPVGTIVTGTEQRAVWRKEPSGWSNLWSDTGWNTVTLLNEFTIATADSAPRWRRIGDLVTWRGIIRFPLDYVPFGGGPGFVNFCSVPAAAVPAYNMLRSPTTAAANPPGVGQIRYTDGYFQAWCDSDGSRSMWWPVDMSYHAGS